MYNKRVLKRFEQLALKSHTIVESFGRRGYKMPEIKVKDGNIEDAIKKLKRQNARNGLLQELRKRECYEKPSVKRKKKSEAARKRKY